VTIAKHFKDGSPLTMPGDNQKPAVLIMWGVDSTESVWMEPESLQRDIEEAEFLSRLALENKTYLNLKGITSESDFATQVKWSNVELGGKPYCAFRFVNHISPTAFIEHQIIDEPAPGVRIYIDSVFIPINMPITEEEILLIPAQMFNDQRLDTEVAYQAENSEVVQEEMRPYDRPPSLNLNRDLNQMNAAISGSPVDALYHITHIDNLSSILEHGLVSHNLAHDYDLLSKDISLPEVNQLRDRTEPVFNRNLHDYVPLYFYHKNPMLYLRQISESDLVILQISKVLIASEGTIFTDGNAASFTTQFRHSVEEFSSLPFENIFGPKNWTTIPDGKRIRCAEVLVHERIDVPHIKAIICKSESLTEKVNILIGGNSPIKVKLDASYFF